MYRGFVKIHRELEEWALYKHYGAVQLLIHFLIKASHKEKKISFMGKPYLLKAGEFTTGRKLLSLETGLSEQQIRVLISKFVKWEEISVKSTSQCSLITLLKWDKFQIGVENQPAKEPTSNQRATNNQPLNKNDKNVNNEKKKLLKQAKEKEIEESFNLIWNKYPKKQGRKAAFKHFKATVKNEVDYSNIQIALDKYLCYVEAEGIENRFIKNGSTWFNCWDEWIDYEIVITKPKQKGGITDNEYREELERIAREYPNALSHFAQDEQKHLSLTDGN